MAGLLALVTGAAGESGKAAARALAAMGIDLVLVDIDRPNLLRIAADLAAIPRVCDVGNDTEVRDLLDGLCEEVGPPDILVNAAGTGYLRALGMMRMTSALMPFLRQRPTASLVLNLEPDSAATQEQQFAYASSASGFARMSDVVARMADRSGVMVASADKYSCADVLRLANQHLGRELDPIPPHRRAQRA